MKKLLVLVALIGLSVPALVGCGSGSPTVIEPVTEEDGALSADQQRQYDERRVVAGHCSKKQVATRFRRHAVLVSFANRVLGWPQYSAPTQRPKTAVVSPIVDVTALLDLVAMGTPHAVSVAAEVK